MLRKAITHIRYALLIAGLVLCLLGVIQAATGNIDATDKYAWSTNAGWINLRPEHGGVTVYADHLEGYAWAENIGWIRLGTHTGGSPYTYLNTTKDNYGVNNDGNGNLSGYAWGTTVGWIKFDPTGGGVTIDTDTGRFEGYAWGENVGWIHFSSPYGVVASGGSIDTTDKYAWSSGAGWINFNPTHGGVMLYDDHLEGYAWGENIGWIRLGTHEGGGAHTYGNTSATDYGVNNDGIGNLSGYAWSINAGWINFNPTHGRVTIDPATGRFEGYAWGENVGWVHFEGPYGVVTTYQGVQTSTGTGAAQLASDKGLIEDLAAVAEETLAPEGKPDLDFPHGFFSFNITGLTPCASETVVVTITLPSAVPATTQYWKCHDGTWLDVTSLLGDNDGDNVLTLTLTDGGLGDDDGECNGEIVDDGGPGQPPAPPPVPVGGIVAPVNRLELLAPWMGLAALVSLAALTIALVRRRRG